MTQGDHKMRAWHDATDEPRAPAPGQMSSKSLWGPVAEQGGTSRRW